MTSTITLDTPMSFQEALQHLNDGKCVGIRPNNNTNFLVPYKYGEAKRYSLCWSRRMKDKITNIDIPIEQYLGVWYPVVLDCRKLPTEIKNSLLLENITGVLDSLTYEKD